MASSMSELALLILTLILLVLTAGWAALRWRRRGAPPAVPASQDRSDAQSTGAATPPTPRPPAPPPSQVAASPSAAAPPDPRASTPPAAPEKPHRVFLSYRREDSADVVGRIYDRLVQRFGAPQVFKDVDSVRLGVDFRQHLRGAVADCSVLLAVIGPGWRGAQPAGGGSRLDSDRDYVRIELEAALGREIPVIPLLVRGAEIPSEEQLPTVLAPLAYRNGLAIRSDPDFHRDMDRLVGALEPLMGSGAPSRTD